MPNGRFILLFTCSRFQNERELTADRTDIRIHSSESVGENYVLCASLTFTAVTLDDTADIEVVAQNVAGQDSSVARLQVHSNFNYCDYKLNAN